jgi:hypothetical protein
MIANHQNMTGAARSARGIVSRLMLREVVCFSQVRTGLSQDQWVESNIASVKLMSAADP